uniref:Ectonucleoside triphosphate diphosphohydrolase 4 n=1 Tax=Pavo cristatus TaxID=9049 RepID=A0A8C9F9Z6_PAVCR
QDIPNRKSQSISEFANTPEKVSDYIFPLLHFAAEHVPRAKHKETPLYILCTAGMRILPERSLALLIFVFTSRRQYLKIWSLISPLYAWIGINFVLGRFEHTDDEDEAVVEVHIPGSENKEAIIRKRTVGILDMGGVSTQIAYEVPKTVSFASSQQEEVAKNLLAEFNLGCDAHQTEHVYRVYVATFLGFGGNAARQRYENSVFSSTVLKNGLLGRQTGMTSDSPYLDPCLPVDAQDEIHQNGQIMYLRGTGDFNLCRELIQPFMNKTNETQTSLNGVYQPAVHFQNSEFYGFSEFYYSTEDVLRMGGDYNAAKFIKAAKDYCATKWPVLRERFDRGLYASHADLHRLKYQCFKSAWVYEVFHSGFSFPASYSNLKTALQVYDKEVQWTLGAILYRTRFLPLRDIQQENFRGSHSHWRSFSFVYNHYLFFVCFLIVLLSILLYLLRLRRIHRRMLRNSSSPSLWMEEGLPPQKISAAL